MRPRMFTSPRSQSCSWPPKPNGTGETRGGAGPAGFLASNRRPKGSKLRASIAPVVPSTMPSMFQMSQGAGEFHSFSESVTAFEGSGTVSEIVGGDGISRQMLDSPGSYMSRSGNWYDGVFQFIKEADGWINHRLFVPRPQWRLRMIEYVQFLESRGISLAGLGLSELALKRNDALLTARQGHSKCTST